MSKEENFAVAEKAMRAFADAASELEFVVALSNRPEPETEGDIWELASDASLTRSDVVVSLLASVMLEVVNFCVEHPEDAHEGFAGIVKDALDELAGTLVQLDGERPAFQHVSAGVQAFIDEINDLMRQ